MGKTNEKLQSSCKDAKLLEGGVFYSEVSAEKLIEWINGLNIKQYYI